MMRFLYLFVLSIFFWNTSLAQVFEPVKWSFSSEHIAGDEFNLKFVANMDENWSVYSQFTEDNGPVPTSFEYDPGDHFNALGKITEKGHKKEGHDPLFGVNVIKFIDGQVTFTQKVKVIDYAKPISGYLTFMTCDNERCLPPTDVDFTFMLSPQSATEAKVETEKTEVVAVETEAKKTNTAKEKAEIVEESKKDEKIELSIDEEEKEPKSKILEPVKWSFEHKKVSDSEFDLVLTANLMEGWAIYSQHTGEDGPLPTEFEFEKGDHFELVGAVKEEGDKKEGPDPLFDNVIVSKYPKGPVVFTQRVKVTDPSKPIAGFVSFMACDEARCIAPPAKDFTFALSSAASVANTANIVGDVIDQERPVIRSTYTNPIGDCGDEDVARDKSLLLTFIFGFLGGLIALLTPCVFPMIPLTVSYFTKSSKDKKSGLRNALLYGLSIVVIYVTIGLLITSVFGADALQQLSTDWIANTLFFIVFIVFAISFFGYFEITLPSSWSNKTDSMADKGGLLGIFFMAFTLAIVSFSCTGPIIGSALVQSATNSLGPFVVMLGFSVALALPFGLFAAFPGWLNSLPRSGSWMTSVKVVLGFLELALALKFLSVADMTMHWGILPYEIFLALWILIFAGTTIYLLGWIRFPHDSKLKKMSITRWVFTGIFAAFTIYLITGFAVNQKTNLYNSLALMSGLAPPAYYNIFLEDPVPDPEIKAKYPSYSIGANNLRYFKDYYEGIAYAKEVNKPVFLDFTGYGCVNCRKTEEHIWVVDKIWRSLQEDFVLVSLYTDDREKLEKILISKRNGSKLRNVGNKWADFQIINFEQNSQPLYVMMAPDERVLAAPRGFKEGADDYAEFMECGLEVYRGLK